MEGRYLIDTYGWIEYFKGSDKGEKTKEYISGGDCITPTIVIAELSDKYNREGLKNFKRDLEFIETNTIVKGLSRNAAVNSGGIKRELKGSGIGLADAVILAIAREEGASVVTGDKHFKGLKEVAFLD